MENGSSTTDQTGRRALLGGLGALGALALVGCATGSPSAPAAPNAAPSGPAGGATPVAPALDIDTRYTSRGQDSRVLFLIIHYTVANFPLSLKVLTEGEVSSHYLLSDETPPRIYRLVDESRRAWHSGPSYWRGHGMLNANSVGIEIVHPGFIETPQGRQFVPFPKAQIDVLIPLVQDIVKRHSIRPERILGHNEVLPLYKQDPGPTFPWRRLAEAGIGTWPDAARVAQQRARFEAAAPDVAWWRASLAQHGFFVERQGELDETLRTLISTFQMRYRPDNYSGLPDAETAALLQVLITPVAP